jgi:hypothetical protein
MVSGRKAGEKPADETGCDGQCGYWQTPKLAEQKPKSEARGPKTETNPKAESQIPSFTAAG